MRRELYCKAAVVNLYATVKGVYHIGVQYMESKKEVTTCIQLLEYKDVDISTCSNQLFTFPTC